MACDVSPVAMFFLQDGWAISSRNFSKILGFWILEAQSQYICSLQHVIPALSKLAFTDPQQSKTLQSMDPQSILRYKAGDPGGEWNAEEVKITRRQIRMIITPDFDFSFWFFNQINQNKIKSGGDHAKTDPYDDHAGLVRQTGDGAGKEFYWEERRQYDATDGELADEACLPRLHPLPGRQNRWRKRLVG